MNKTKTLTTTGIALAFGLSMASAFAADIGTDVATFDELDTNHDGFISRSEARALPCLAENFDELDKSDDRGLDRNEFRQAVAEYCRD